KVDAPETSRAGRNEPGIDQRVNEVFVVAGQGVLSVISIESRTSRQWMRRRLDRGSRLARQQRREQQNADQGEPYSDEITCFGTAGWLHGASPGGSSSSRMGGERIGWLGGPPGMCRRACCRC